LDFGRRANRKNVRKLIVYYQSEIRSRNQLAHAGRKASAASPWNGGRKPEPTQGGWDTVAQVLLRIIIPKSTSCIKPGITKVISDFKSATKK
jgi:2,4-dienoyl-CoA reductase-like NADH-dependent reductase (Old Yellow Enzyme family)